MRHAQNSRVAGGIELFAKPADVVPPGKSKADWQVILTTGRNVWQYHTRTMTEKSQGLNALAPENFIEIKPINAKKYDVVAGDTITVASRRGRIIASLVSDAIRPGVIFIPFRIRSIGNSNWLAKGNVAGQNTFQISISGPWFWIKN